MVFFDADFWRQGYDLPLELPPLSANKTIYPEGYFTEANLLSHPPVINLTLFKHAETTHNTLKSSIQRAGLERH